MRISDASAAQFKTQRSQSKVWVYRFSHPAEAAAQLSYHPSLAATATALRAAVLCRTLRCLLFDVVCAVAVMQRGWAARTEAPLLSHHFQDS